ncbi:MAG: DUF2066 domain-containing protein [Gammaproteobacteria bacterium]
MSLLVLALFACIGLVQYVPSAAASSAGQDALYSAATPVPDQSAKARKEAFSRDLVQVFVKVSGNPAIAQVSALAPLLDNAGNLVVEYRYRSVPISQGGGQTLWAHFDHKAVDKALAQAGQGTWGQGRPTVVAWVLNAGSIEADNPNDPVVAAMRKSASQRGLPLVLPLMDLTDQKQVSGFDIRTLYLPALQSASARYGARAMLVGDIKTADRGVNSRWTLVFGQSTAPYQMTAATPQAAGAKAVAQAATLLAQQLAYVGGAGGSGSVMVVVAGVRSLVDLTRVERLFTNVPGVSTATLDAIRGEVVRFRVDYAGAPNDLARALTVSSSFAQAARPATTLAPAAASASAQPVPELDLRYTP